MITWGLHVRVRMAVLVGSMMMGGILPDAAAQATPRVPRLESAACSPAVPAGERIDCRTLVVWEDRARKAGALVRVPVTIYRSRSATPEPDPVLWLPGGPGAGAQRRRAADIALLDRRDYVVMEQRGTARATPALDCPGITAVRERIARGLLLERAAIDSAWLEAGEQCATGLRAAGVNLAMYTSLAIAADVEDLRALLGVPKLNLYGESYSTRVMLALMRDHPGSIRSVVLDSPMPLESRYDETAAANVMRALEVVVAACVAAPQCAAANPALRESLRSVFDRFARAPVWHPLDSARTDSLRVGADQLASVFAAATRNPNSARAIPPLLTRAAAGRIAPLTGLFAEEVGPSSYTQGLRAAVWCADFMPFQDRGRIAAQRDPAIGLGGIDLTVVPPAVCDRMGIPPSPAREGEAVRSDLPTLIISGELDPWTPPSWGRMLLPNLPRAFMVEVGGRSHTPGFGRCSAGIIARFIDAPDRDPSDPCALRDVGVLFPR